jgi:hypothetical protein
MIFKRAAPYETARQKAVLRLAAWRGTFLAGVHIANVAVVWRRCQWRDTMICGTMQTGAAKKG